MSGRVYLDTSAYVAALLDEADVATLSSAMSRSAYLSSVLLIVETRRTLVRLSREGRIDLDAYLECTRRVEQDMEGFTLREVTLDLCDLAAMPSVATPRSMDLVHLRTAQWFHAQEPIEAFISLDLHQLRAAREIGLPVLPKPSSS